MSPTPKQPITDYHGYGAVDFYGVEEHFGTLAKLRELVDGIVISRGIVNIIYGGRKKVARLSIGNTDWHRKNDDKNPKKVTV